MSGFQFSDDCDIMNFKGSFAHIEKKIDDASRVLAAEMYNSWTSTSLNLRFRLDYYSPRACL